MTTYEQSTGKEKGLIKSLSGRNHQLIDATKQLSTATTTAVKMIDELGGDVFAYAKANNLKGFAAQWSTISDYTNKKGVVSQAHFNSRGTYVDSVKKAGDTPIKCRCCVAITPKNFTYDKEKGWFVPHTLKKFRKFKINE